MPEEPRDAALLLRCWAGTATCPLWSQASSPPSAAPLCRASPGPGRPHCSLQRAFFPAVQPAGSSGGHAAALAAAKPGRVATPASPSKPRREPALAFPMQTPTELAFWVASCFLVQGKKKQNPTFHAPWHLSATLGHAAAGRRCEPSPGQLAPKCGTPAQAGSTGRAG